MTKVLLLHTRKKSQNEEENQLKMCNVDLGPDATHCRMGKPHLHTKWHIDRTVRRQRTLH